MNEIGLREERIMYDCIVLGAGITGVTTAYQLARAGKKVCVIERQPESAMETTYANGGQISVSHAEPWAHPGALMQVLKWLAQKESPLYFSPHLDWRQWAWLAQWLWQCRASAADRNTVRIVAIAMRSRELYREVRACEGIEYQERSLGILHFYRDKKEYENARRVAELMTKYGCKRIPVTKEEIDALEPTLAPHCDIVGGTYTKDDESGNARLFTQALAGVCETKFGVHFRYGTLIDDLIPRDGNIDEVSIREAGGVKMPLRAQDFVLCMGSYSPLIAQRLGIFLNIYPAKGYSISVPLNSRNETSAPKVSLTDDENKLVFSNLHAHLRVAGTAELAGWNTALSYHRVRPIVEKAAGLFPGVFADLDYRDERSVREHLNPWTGLRPATPSNVPYCGRSRKYPNLWFNTGHGTLGWTMGMGTAEMIVKMMLGR
jgi:D-amino-acid dehydrogenase